MIAIDHGHGWWGLEISRRCWAVEAGTPGWALVAVLWFRPCCWLTERVRWRDGWDFNLGPLSLEWRRWA